MVDYEKKYNDLMAKLQGFVSIQPKVTQDAFFDMFSELQVSENERIRKMVLKAFKLFAEKQSFVGHCLDDIDWDKCIAWLEKQGEQKFADETKLKIEEGKWYVCISQFCNCIEGRVYKATSDSRIIDDFGTEYDMHSDAYKYFRLWTIQDAKDGDLIYVSTEEKGIQAIFHEYKNKTIFFHCYLCSDFVQGGYMPIGSVELVYPLQKVNYRKFFEKMRKAGYEWDAEHNQLKKIEQKPILDVEIPFGTDSELVEEAITIPDGCYAIIENNKVILRKGEQKPAEWSEEDVRKMRAIVTIINSTQQSIICSIDQDRESLCNWLKSLKPQSQWKPSEEQLQTIDFIISYHVFAEPKRREVLKDLLEQLKAL